MAVSQKKWTCRPNDLRIDPFRISNASYHNFMILETHAILFTGRDAAISGIKFTTTGSMKRGDELPLHRGPITCQFDGGQNRRKPI